MKQDKEQSLIQKVISSSGKFFMFIYKIAFTFFVTILCINSITFLVTPLARQFTDANILDKFFAYIVIILILKWGLKEYKEQKKEREKLIQYEFNMLCIRTKQQGLSDEATFAELQKANINVPWGGHG